MKNNSTNHIYLYRVRKNGKKTEWLWYGKYTIEEKIKLQYPHLAAKRGIAKYWNFLPPDELNEILSYLKAKPEPKNEKNLNNKQSFFFKKKEKILQSSAK